MEKESLLSKINSHPSTDTERTGAEVDAPIKNGQFSDRLQLILNTLVSHSKVSLLASRPG